MYDDTKYSNNEEDIDSYGVKGKVEEE